MVEEDRPLESGASHLVRAGTTLRFGPAVRGVRAYLALPGGIAVEPVLGSRSTCLSGGFGGLDGRPLAAGDRLDPSTDPMLPSPGAAGPPAASTRPTQTSPSGSWRCPRRPASIPTRSRR